MFGRREGLRKGAASRRSSILPDDIRQLARTGGVKLFNRPNRGLLEIFLEDMLRAYLKAVIADILTYTERAETNPITTMDGPHAVRRQATILDGFED